MYSRQVEVVGQLQFYPRNVILNRVHYYINQPTHFIIRHRLKRIGDGTTALIGDCALAGPAQ